MMVVKAPIVEAEELSPLHTSALSSAVSARVSGISGPTEPERPRNPQLSISEPVDRRGYGGTQPTTLDRRRDNARHSARKSFRANDLVDRPRPQHFRRPLHGVRRRHPRAQT